MPKITGGANQASGKCWNDTYLPHPVTIGGLDAVLRASAWKSRNKEHKGWNGAAIQERINYMRRAIRVGLVQSECIHRAIKTVHHLEEQLCQNAGS